MCSKHSKGTGDELRGQRVLHVDLTPADEGGYIVSIREIPSCVTQGDTQAEAIENATDAINLYVAELAARDEACGETAPVRAQLKEMVYAY